MKRRRKAGGITHEALKRALIESNGAAFFDDLVRRADAERPPRPQLPESAPKYFHEAIFWKGPVALPLYNENLGRWRFMLMYDGVSLYDLRDGSLVMCDDYEDGMESLRKWAESKGA